MDISPEEMEATRIARWGKVAPYAPQIRAAARALAKMVAGAGP